MMDLKLLGHNCWRQKATQIVSIPLVLGESETFVIARISQQRIPTSHGGNATKTVFQSSQ